MAFSSSHTGLVPILAEGTPGTQWTVSTSRSISHNELFVPISGWALESESRLPQCQQQETLTLHEGWGRRGALSFPGVGGGRMWYLALGAAECEVRRRKRKSRNMRTGGITSLS